MKASTRKKVDASAVRALHIESLSHRNVKSRLSAQVALINPNLSKDIFIHSQ